MAVRESFDYVVVGAGSAGAVVAARLTEDPDTSVLLLEAGGAADADEISIPAAFANLFKTRWDWNYQTSEQKQLESRRAYWPRMKALGGCSSMNAMIYIRGNRADYDTWRDSYGATGWGYDDVLPAFIRSEGNTRLGGPFHGQDGPLHVEDRRYTHPLTHAWIESAVAAGFKPTDDFNGAEQEGAGLYQVTCRKGRRWSTANGPTSTRPTDRPNLTIRTGALAERVVVEGGRAVGRDLPARPDQPDDVRQRRGRARRRCGQLTSAADALGHRPRRPPAARSASTCSSTSPAWARTCTTTRRYPSCSAPGASPT